MAIINDLLFLAASAVASAACAVLGVVLQRQRGGGPINLVVALCYAWSASHAIGALSKYLPLSWAHTLSVVVAGSFSAIFAWQVYSGRVRLFGRNDNQALAELRRKLQVYIEKMERDLDRVDA